MIEDPTQANSRVAKDTVIVGQKASSDSKDETTELKLGDSRALHSVEVRNWLL